MALADTNALCTLAEVKSKLGISGSSLDDELEATILAASGLIESYCARAFKYDAAKVERLAGYGTQHLFPSLTPIEELTELLYEGNAVDLSRVIVDGAMITHLDGVFLDTRLLNGGIDPTLQGGTERPLYVLTYAGGYVLPNDASPTLPKDLQMAARMLACDLYRKDSRDQAVSAESVGGAALQYATSVDAANSLATAIPGTVRVLLGKYKRAVVA